MIVLVSVLCLLLIISIYINYNLYTKVDYLTVYINNLIESIDIMRTRVLEMNNRLKAIDHRGSFEADDEVGFFFKDLQEIQTRLNILFSIVNDKPLSLDLNGLETQSNPEDNE